MKQIRPGLKPILPVIFLFALFAAGAIYAGGLLCGLAVITVEDLPDSVLAGEPFPLAFTVRQHGQRRVPGLHPTVRAVAGARAVQVDAAPGKEEGLYVATLALPHPGEWTITIHSSFLTSNITLLPLRVMDSEAGAPRALNDADRGRRLFVAKGCISCHQHNEVQVRTIAPVGPALDDKRYPADYLSQLLADPARWTRKNSWGMPNLQLKQQEIEALIAFINADRTSRAANAQETVPPAR